MVAIEILSGAGTAQEMADVLEEIAQALRQGKTRGDAPDWELIDPEYETDKELGASSLTDAEEEAEEIEDDADEYDDEDDEEDDSDDWDSEDDEDDEDWEDEDAPTDDDDL